MQPASPDSRPEVSPLPIRLLWLVLLIGIGLLAAFVGLVLLVGMEMAISVNAPRYGAPPPGTGPNLIYMTLRGVAHLLVSGVIAGAIYRLTAPPRRRYWIALGIVAAILISPAGVVVYKAGFVLLILILGIPVGG